MHQEKKLFIRNVDSESAGRYTCTIINKAGSDYRNFLVSVYHPPSFDNTQGPFSKDPSSLAQWILGFWLVNNWKRPKGNDNTDHEVILSGSVTLDCKVSGGVPIPQIKWYKFGEPLRPNLKLGYSLFFSRNRRIWGFFGNRRILTIFTEDQKWPIASSRFSYRPLSDIIGHFNIGPFKINFKKALLRKYKLNWPMSKWPVIS